MNFINGILTTAGSELGDFALRLLVCILILVVGVLVIHFGTKAAKKRSKTSRLDKGLVRFSISCVRAVCYIVLFLTAAAVVGIPMTSFVTLLASAGVAIGLALQGALSNFAGGVMILIFKPFKIGDFVEVAEGSGTVHDISIFYTKINTVDGKTLTLPNGELTNKSIINYSHADTDCVALKFTSAFGSDTDNVLRVLTDTAKAHPLVLETPAPASVVLGQLDSAIQYELHVYCKRGNYATVYFDLQNAMLKAFADNGITIPFPQLDVHTN